MLFILIVTKLLSILGRYFRGEDTVTLADKTIYLSSTFSVGSRPRNPITLFFPSMKSEAWVQIQALPHISCIYD